MSKDTRSGDILLKLVDDIFKKRQLLDLSRVQQLPTFKYVIERYLTMKNELPKTEKDKENKVISFLVSELRFI